MYDEVRLLEAEVVHQRVNVLGVCDGGMPDERRFGLTVSATVVRDDKELLPEGFELLPPTRANNFRRARISPLGPHLPYGMPA